MKYLENQLTEKTLGIIKEEFGSVSIYERDITLVIETEEAMNFEWAKFIAKELNTKCKLVSYNACDY